MPITGLTTKEAKKRLQTYGPNLLKESKPPGICERFLAQLKDFMIITLLAAAGISFILSFFGEDGDYIDAVIILAIVILNAILGMIQEAKAERSLAALKKLSTPVVNVMRDGSKSLLPTSQLVPGDIMLLEAGNYIPADGKLLSCLHLQTEESALTGESMEIVKIPGDSVFSGTIVVTGNGYCQVSATGMSTELGKIAGLLSHQEVSDTPLQKKLSHTGKTLGLMAMFICILIFILGILKRQPVFPMFMTSVSLAVAAIPEGLPAIVTIMLSLGVERMARRHAVIRRLPAVETLGSATVICSDKTGTLTENRLTVSDTFSYDNEITLIRYSLLCNHQSGGLEKALVRHGETLSLFWEKEQSLAPILDEIPFDSTRKCMTTLHRFQGKYLSISKGAPEIILQHASSYLDQGTVRPLTSRIRAAFTDANHSFAKEALRVVAVSYQFHRGLPRCTCASLERDTILVGLIASFDPPRPEAVEAIAKCRQAGIRPVMITGDHPLTAMAIGAKLGFPSQEVLTGADLAQLDDPALEATIYQHSIYARVLPVDKVRLVKAFQHHREVVAMTGDGVNDAPALKAADIGCAMGLGGTDVAKSASDMILTDDNFATILAAVEEGRGIYDNIRKAVFFLLFVLV